MSHYISIFFSDTQKCWCRALRRPINKYLAVTPELACAKRYVGYLASGEKALVIH